MISETDGFFRRNVKTEDITTISVVEKKQVTQFRPVNSEMLLKYARGQQLALTSQKNNGHLLKLVKCQHSLTILWIDKKAHSVSNYVVSVMFGLNHPYKLTQCCRHLMFTVQVGSSMCNCCIRCFMLLLAFKAKKSLQIANHRYASRYLSEIRIKSITFI